MGDPGPPERKPLLVLEFNPQRWGQFGRFKRFWPTTYRFSREDAVFLAGVEGHVHKFQVLRGLADELIPRLEKDRDELREDGFTNASESKKLAAVVEGMLGELYSTIDCVRHVLLAVYPELSPNAERSLGRFLEDAANRKLGAAVPDAIKAELADTEWSEEFRELRNRSVHSDPGSCHWGKDREVSYMSSLREEGPAGERRAVVTDVMAFLDELLVRLQQMIEVVFGALNQTLSDSEMPVICGIFNGRVYERTIKPSEATSFNGGRCKSRAWFDRKPDDLKCPLRDRCGAYQGPPLSAP